MTKAVFVRHAMACAGLAVSFLPAVLLKNCGKAGRFTMHGLCFLAMLLVMPVFCQSPSPAWAVESAFTALPGDSAFQNGRRSLFPLQNVPAQRFAPVDSGGGAQAFALQKTYQYWDGAGTIGNGEADGGPGEWNSSSTNWTGSGDGSQEPDFSRNTTWQGQGSVAVFAGQGGIVSVQGTQNFDSLQFRSDGYALMGGMLQIAPYEGTTGGVLVEAGLTATIESGISGGGLRKTGAGSLVLTGRNDYSGKTEISDGRLVAGAPDSLSSVSFHELSGGALDLESAPQHIGGLSGNAGEVRLGSATLTVNQPSSAVFSGAFKGDAGSRLALRGTGELSLMNIEDFAGSFDVDEGAMLELAGPAGVVLNHALSGSGLMALKAASASDSVSLGERTGREFTGVIEVRRGALSLDDAAEGTLAGAGLRLNAGASAELDQNRSIHSLDLDGGELRYLQTASRPFAVLTVEDLAVSDKGATVLLGERSASGGRVAPANLDRNLYDYGASAGQTLLVAANGNVSGSAEHIALFSPDGSRLDEVRTVTVEQNGARVGQALFGTAAELVTSGERKGLYYREGLTELVAVRGKRIELDSDRAGSSSPQLDAKLTGAGGFTFTGASQALVGNALSAYTGSTRVEGANLAFKTDNAFGKTASLYMDGQSKVDLRGHSQTIGGLSGVEGAVLSLGADSVSTGRLVVNQSADTDFGGVLAGYGELQKLGSGRLTLSGSNSLRGETDIRAGSLVVQGGLGSGRVGVRNNASLGIFGGGLVEGDVEVAGGGALILGNGGTIGGDLSMAENAVIAARSDNAALKVNGAVNLAEGLQLQLRGSNWTTGSYDLLAPADPADIVGFSGVYVPGFMEEYSVVSQGDKLVLRYTERDSGTLSANQRRVFTVLGDLDRSGPMYQALSGIEASALGSALDSLSGEIHSSLRNSLFLVDRSFSKRLSSHISHASLSRRPILIDESTYMDPGDYDRFATSSGNYYGTTYGIWAGLGASYAEVDANGGAAKSTLEGPEVAGGIDFLLGNGTIAGMAIQYSYKDMEVDDRDSDADIHSYTIALYAGRELSVADNVLRLIMGGLYSYHDISTTRQVRVSSVREDLEADYKASSFRLYAEGAYSMVIAEKFMAEPFINIGWNWLRTDRFSEDGGQSALKGGSKPSDIFSSLLGLRFDLPLFDLVHLNASVGWEHIYGSLEPSHRLGFRHGGDSFSIKGNSLSRDELSIGVGAALKLDEDLTIKVNYDGGIGSDSEMHGGSAALIYRW